MRGKPGRQPKPPPLEHRELLRAIIEAEPECVKVLARDGALLDMNPAGLAMIEADAKLQVLGKDMGALIAPEHRRAFTELRAAVFRGESGELEFEVIGLKGTRRWLETRAVPLRDPDGTVTVMLGITRDITERRRAEADLRASQSRFQGILEASLDAFVMIDAGGRITSWSPRAEALFGWAAGEVVGRTLIETIIPPQHRAAHQRGLAHFLVTGEGPILGRRIEVTALQRSGLEFPVELAVSPLRYGDAWSFGAFIRDITAPRHAQQLQAAIYRIADATQTTRGLEDLLAAIHGIVGELMPADNFYVALLDPTSGLLTFPYFVDEHDTQMPPKPLGKGLTEYVLRTGEPLLATPEVHEELMRRGAADLIGAPSIDWLGVPLQVRNQTIGVLVVQTYTPGVRYGEQEKEILQFVSSQVAMAIERKRAEAELRESARHYRLLFEANPEPMWVIDRQTRRFLAVNDAALRRYGYAREEFLRMTAADIVPPDDPPELERAARLAAGQTTYTGVRHRTRDGTILDVEVVLDDIEFAGHPARLVLARNVTERLRVEAQLRQAQKMEAVGRLAGGIAHDFNNILTAIGGYSSLLLDDLPLQDPRREDVEEIRKSADRAAALTRQLLAFSRRQVLQPKVLDLNAVVTGAEKLLHRLIGEDIGLATRTATALWAVRADPGQMEQVIVNLAVNARDAMPVGGSLTIETANVQLDERFAADHQPVTPGDYVLLSVSDTGVGMDAETRAHLFEPFFTTKEQGKGTGLGLATVYGIVKQSDGFIWVYSEPGHGSTFKLYFPRTAAAVDAAEPTRAAPRARLGTETVLLVEDEPAVRRVAHETLQRQGYTVLEAPGGAAALAVAAGHGAPIDLLLTDIVMPEMGGPELARRLTPNRPHLKVLFMSGYTDDAIVRHGVLEPGVAYLQKPFRPDTLAHKVREVLDG